MLQLNPKVREIQADLEEANKVINRTFISKMTICKTVGKKITTNKTTLN